MIDKDSPASELSPLESTIYVDGGYYTFNPYYPEVTWTDIQTGVTSTVLSYN